MKIKIIDQPGQACTVALLKSSDNPTLSDPEFREGFLLAPRPVTVATVVPLYTEPAYVLQRTLSGLAMQQEDLRRCAAAGTETHGKTDIPVLHILVVADGNAKLSDSMRQYLEEMFPAFTPRTFDPTWYEDAEDVKGLVPQPENAEWRSRAQLAVFNRIEPYVRDEHKASGQTGRETARDGGDETARGLMPTTPGRRVSETYEQRRRGLTRMPSRISYSSLKRAVAGTDPMADAAARAIAESSSVYGGDDVEVDDNAYVISPVEVDVTHAIMSQARVLEMQSVLAGSTFSNPTPLEAVPESAKQRLYVTLDVKRRLYITLVVKQQNRKKHNSNRLFFDVFSQLCTQVNFTRYYFCTDAGTLYAPHMLCELLGHLEANPDCAACCGHQRIMHYRDQMDPEESMAGARENWRIWWLRSIQGADCEQGICVFNGLHSRLGFLSVVPGPCGLFRASAVTHDVLDQVNLVCATANSLDDILTANLRLAEDRVISYLIILRSPSPTRTVTSWVPKAHFFFECEETQRELTLQRRRWINGTLMGYPWLLTRKELWGSIMHTSGSRSFQALAMLALCLVQILIYILCLTMPAFFGCIGHLTVTSFGLIAAVMGLNVSESVIFWLQVAHWIIFGGTWLVHMYLARFYRLPYNAFSWTLRTVVNAVTISGNALAMLALFSLTLTSWGENVAAQVSDGPLVSFWVAFMAGLLFVSTPIIVAYMHSEEVFKAIVSTYSAYYVFLPTIVSDFLTYSLCRLDDWSWGNKDKMVATPSGGGAVKDTSSQWTQTYIVSNFTPFLILFGNFGVAGLIMWLAYANIKVALAALGQAFTGIGLSIMCCSALFFVFRRHRFFVTVLTFLSWITAGVSSIAISLIHDRFSTLWRFFFILYWCALGFIIFLVFAETIWAHYVAPPPAQASPALNKAHTSMVAAICAKTYRVPVVRADKLSNAVAVPEVEIGRLHYLFAALMIPVSPLIVLFVFLVEQMRWVCGGSKAPTPDWSVGPTPGAEEEELAEQMGTEPVGRIEEYNVYVTTVAVPALRPFTHRRGDRLMPTVTMLRLLNDDGINAERLQQRSPAAQQGPQGGWSLPPLQLSGPGSQAVPPQSQALKPKGTRAGRVSFTGSGIPVEEGGGSRVGGMGSHVGSAASSVGGSGQPLSDDEDYGGDAVGIDVNVHGSFVATQQQGGRMPQHPPQVADVVHQEAHYGSSTYGAAQYGAPLQQGHPQYGAPQQQQQQYGAPQYQEPPPQQYAPQYGGPAASLPQQQQQAAPQYVPQYVIASRRMSGGAPPPQPPAPAPQYVPQYVIASRRMSGGGAPHAQQPQQAQLSPQMSAHTLVNFGIASPEAGAARRRSQDSVDLVDAQAAAIQARRAAELRARASPPVGQWQPPQYGGAPQTEYYSGSGGEETPTQQQQQYGLPMQPRRSFRLDARPPDGETLSPTVPRPARRSLASSAEPPHAAGSILRPASGSFLRGAVEATVAAAAGTPPRPVYAASSYEEASRGRRTSQQRREARERDRDSSSLLPPTYGGGAPTYASPASAQYPGAAVPAPLPAAPPPSAVTATPPQSVLRRSFSRIPDASAPGPRPMHIVLDGSPAAAAVFSGASALPAGSVLSGSTPPRSAMPAPGSTVSGGYSALLSNSRARLAAAEAGGAAPAAPRSPTSTASSSVARDVPQYGAPQYGAPQYGAQQGGQRR